MRSILIIVLLCSMLAGCTKTLYVPVESVRTEYVDKLQRDSIYFYDKEHIYTKGDTVFVDKWRYKYKDRIRVDSIIIRDSIQVPYLVEKIVMTNKLYWWQKSLMRLGVAVLLSFIVIWLIKMKK